MTLPAPLRLKSPRFRRVLATAAAALAVASAASASTLGTDNASNYTTATWVNGSNGGTGFGAWAFSNNNDNATNFAGYFIGDSTGGGSGIGNVNTGTSSFGMYANPGGAFANADRTFAGGALTVGQTFQMRLAVNFRNGGKGLNLYTGGTPVAGTQVFNFNVGNSGGVDGYYYTIGAGTAVNTGFAYASDSVFTLGYTQQSATAGLFTITRTSAATPASNGTVNVPFTATGVTSFRAYNSNATSSGSDNLFFNNLAIVPEPSAWTAMLLGGIGTLLVVRRRGLFAR